MFVQTIIMRSIRGRRVSHDRNSSRTWPYTRWTLCGTIINPCTYANSFGSVAKTCLNTNMNCWKIWRSFRRANLQNSGSGFIVRRLANTCDIVATTMDQCWICVRLVNFRRRDCNWVVSSAQMVHTQMCPKTRQRVPSFTSILSCLWLFPAAFSVNFP